MPGHRPHAPYFAQDVKTKSLEYIPLSGENDPHRPLTFSCRETVHAQLYVMLFECYSDRKEWKKGLTAVMESLQCVPPDVQVGDRVHAPNEQRLHPFVHTIQCSAGSVAFVRLQRHDQRRLTYSGFVRVLRCES